MGNHVYMYDLSIFLKNFVLRWMTYMLNQDHISFKKLYLINIMING